MRRPQHRGEVAAEFAGVADVQREQIEQIVAQLSGLVELDRRNAQAFLKDLGGRRIVGAMGGAADVALMGAHDGPEQALAAVEHRHERGEIRQMAAAMIGIVEQDDVARLHVLEPLLDRERRPGQRADMDRDVVGLRDQAAARVADRQREIAAGIEDLRIGGAKHGFAHLLHDRTETMLDDGAGDGIDLGGHSCLVVCARSASLHLKRQRAPSRRTADRALSYRCRRRRIDQKQRRTDHQCPRHEQQHRGQSESAATTPVVDCISAAPRKKARLIAESALPVFCASTSCRVIP